MQIAAFQRVFGLGIPVHFLGRDADITHAVREIPDVSRRARTVDGIEQVPPVADLLELRAFGVPSAREIDEPH